MRTATLVVPCFDEATRLSDAAVLALVDREDERHDDRIAVILVDDGSQDATWARLQALAMLRPDAITALRLPENQGKGAAIRVGLLAAIERGATMVGYADADFATPAHEILRLRRVLVDLPPTVSVVMGARVARLGARIDRSPLRHGLGRVFATIAALALDAQVYDTQCGAKWLRVSPTLVSALATPFRARWAFDLELLLRLLGRIDDVDEPLPLSAIVEIPLDIWTDVRGSKLAPLGMARALAEVVVLLRRARLGPARIRSFSRDLGCGSPVSGRRDV